MSVRMIFLSPSIYSEPLSRKRERKFRGLSDVVEVTVVGRREGWIPVSFQQHARFVLLPRFPFRLIRWFTFFTLAPLVTLREIFVGGDTVLVSQSPLAGCTGPMIKRVAGWLGREVVLVVEAHGDFLSAAFEYHDLPFRWMLGPLMEKVTEFTVRRADILRCISDATEELLESRRGDAPLFRFPAFMEGRVFLDAGEENAVLDAKGDAGPPTFLFAGVLTPLKGLPELVEAFGAVAGEHPEARLHLAGEALDSARKEELEEAVQRRGLEESVEFLGHISPEALAGHMAEATCLVLPSRSEGYGRVIVEAMATGTPVIATRVGGIPELIEHGKTGYLVEPRAPRELADRMLEIVADPERLGRMSRAARASGKERLEGAGFFESYAEIHQTAVRMMEARR